MEKRYISVKELVDYIGLSRWTINEMVNNFQIPFKKIRTRTKFDIKLIDEWMAKDMVKPISNSENARARQHKKSLTL